MRSNETGSPLRRPPSADFVLLKDATTDVAVGHVDGRGQLVIQFAWPRRRNQPPPSHVSLLSGPYQVLSQRVCGRGGTRLELTAKCRSQPCEGTRSPESGS